jgi:hypothetical protein
VLGRVVEGRVSAIAVVCMPRSAATRDTTCAVLLSHLHGALSGGEGCEWVPCRRASLAMLACGMRH